MISTFLNYTYLNLKIRKIVLALLLYIPSITLSQSLTTVKWKFCVPKQTITPYSGYDWQGLNTFELGLKLLKFKKGHDENISLIGSGIIFKQNNTLYLAPNLKLRYYKPLNSNYSKRIAGIASLSLWRNEVLNIEDIRFTPEIGIGFLGLFDFTYGYNFSLSKYQQDFFSPHRISIHLTVF